MAGALQIRRCSPWETSTCSQASRGMARSHPSACSKGCPGPGNATTQQAPSDNPPSRRHPSPLSLQPCDFVGMPPPPPTHTHTTPYACEAWAALPNQGHTSVVDHDVRGHKGVHVGAMTTHEGLQQVWHQLLPHRQPTTAFDSEGDPPRHASCSLGTRAAALSYRAASQKMHETGARTCRPLCAYAVKHGRYLRKPMQHTMVLAP
jgi:hypothetical protein